MLKQWILMTLSIGVVIKYGACAQQDSKVGTKTCSPERFNEGRCTIMCTVTTDGTLDRWAWTYFTTHGYTYIGIYDGIHIHNESNTHTLSLTLDDYNAGTYQCLFNITEPFIPPYSLNATIKVSHETSGADMNGDCSEDHDCNAMHATCTANGNDRKECQCSGQYNISYSTNYDNPACLTLQPEGGHCYSDRECNWPTQSYACSNNRCRCTEQMTPVNVDGTAKKMCIQPVSLWDECIYDEQCKLNDEHSYCLHDQNGTKYCDCEERYEADNPLGSSTDPTYCYNIGLRVLEIACIALGSFFGLVIIGAMIYYSVKKYK